MRQRCVVEKIDEKSKKARRQASDDKQREGQGTLEAKAFGNRTEGGGIIKGEEAKEKSRATSVCVLPRVSVVSLCSVT